MVVGCSGTAYPFYLYPENPIFLGDPPPLWGMLMYPFGGTGDFYYLPPVLVYIGALQGPLKKEMVFDERKSRITL